MMSVPVMSEGIRSGVNWMRENFRSSTRAMRVDEQRLGQARHADDQAVAADEQRQQHLLDDVLLPDDQLAQLADDLIAADLHPVGQRDVIGRIQVAGPCRQSASTASIELERSKLSVSILA